MRPVLQEWFGSGGGGPFTRALCIPCHLHCPAPGNAGPLLLSAEDTRVTLLGLSLILNWMLVLSLGSGGAEDEEGSEGAGGGWRTVGGTWARVEQLV